MASPQQPHSCLHYVQGWLDSIRKPKPPYFFQAEACGTSKNIYIKTNKPHNTLSFSDTRALSKYQGDCDQKSPWLNKFGWSDFSAVLAKGLCLTFAADKEHTRSPQLGQHSAMMTNHLPAASEPTKWSIIPILQTGQMEAQEQTTHTHKKTNSPSQRGEVWSRAAPSHSWMEKGDAWRMRDDGSTRHSLAGGKWAGAYGKHMGPRGA